MSKNSEHKKPEFDEDKCLAKLKEFFDLGKKYYYRDHRRMRMLDMTDRGDLWMAVGAKFPPYQILPDTNFVAYVKDNLTASLYTTAKSAEIRPTSEDDSELCTKLNLVLDNLWATENIGFKQFQAGERAALLNLGVTQVGWDEKGGSKVVVKNVDPIKYMRDPFSSSLEDAGWVCTYDRFHKSYFLNNKLYKEKFKEFMDELRNPDSSDSIPGYGLPQEVDDSDDHYTLFRWWLKTPEGIDEIHTIDCRIILHRKENIEPSVFPFAELYCNLPGKGLVGVSGPAKIFANNVAYNLMNSLALTSEYKNQRPPKFVSAQSGLNIPAFTKHGAEADRTFVVQQDASKAVHYQQFPTMSPNLPNLMQNMQMNIQDISGVDGKYTGRDTGSIITTGGTEEMLNRVTMIDTPKIVNYEKYTKDLTCLILTYMLQYSPKRKYFIKKPNTTEYETVEVDFPKIDKDTLFDYDIEISSELPKNKQRVAAWADVIMEKQMQYREGGGQVELLTEEEWLMMQDVPFKEMLLERMGFQRDTNEVKNVLQNITQFANLVSGNMSPEEALMATAATSSKTRAGQPLEEAEMAAIQPQAGGLPDPSMLMGGMGGGMPMM